jgi:hypothetical protein
VSTSIHDADRTGHLSLSNILLGTGRDRLIRLSRSLMRATFEILCKFKTADAHDTPLQKATVCGVERATAVNSGVDTVVEADNLRFWRSCSSRAIPQHLAICLTLSPVHVKRTGHIQGLASYSLESLQENRHCDERLASPQVYTLTLHSPHGENLTKRQYDNDMRHTSRRPSLYVRYYMIFESAQGDLQTLHPFWYKAEISRTAELNSDRWLLLRRRALNPAIVLACRSSATIVTSALLTTERRIQSL